jgi:prepilin-type N-terminal cleavage/methylation domain-containing protein
MRSRQPSLPRSRGFSLIEAMISMAILTVGILGAAQVQVLAAAQNGVGRRTTVAASIARDFVESVQRWELDDPRLAAPACGTQLTTNFPITEELVGNEPKPKVKLGFTASDPSLSSTAGDEGEITSALSLDGARYDGRALALITGADGARYQLVWSVRAVNPSNPAATVDCSAREISVDVRFPILGDRYGNVVTTTILYDRSQVTFGGLPEQI